MYYMEEKKIIYEIILSIWNLAKEHGFERLTPEQWESLIEKAMRQKRDFGKYGEIMEMFYREMYRALENYYERKNK